jgi:hypothetical protein
VGPTIYILVVLYKRRIFDSSTLVSIFDCSRQIPTGSIISIFDNSPEPQKDEDIEKFKTCGLSVDYQSFPENKALSKIYNEAIDLSSNFDFMLILDQDSHLDDLLFSVFASAEIMNPSIDLFLPYIIVDFRVVSPGSWSLIKGKYWKKVRTGLVESRNNIAISSGMFIRRSLFNNSKIRFNEVLRLYGIDTDFMLQFQKVRSHFFVLNYAFKHDLSVFAKEDLEVKLRRFRDHIHSTRILSTASASSLIVTEIYIAFKRLQFSLKFGSFRFLFSHD